MKRKQKIKGCTRCTALFFFAQADNLNKQKSAALGGIYLGEYWEAAAVTFLFVFGSYLEARAFGRTRNAIEALVKEVPTEANVLRDGETVKIDISDIKAGETVVVKPGEKIPVDGKIIKGQAAVYEATITGESMPRLKKPGDSVYSTTLNTEGYPVSIVSAIGNFK
ncbi:MAG: hypothetical protein QME73_04690 [Bacillota bacterium]|nr:hypothetical protein [Bacillota bacterium]